MAKRVLRQGVRKDIRKEASDKPLCPIHGQEMKFDPSTMVWRCVTYECPQIAHPKNEVGGNKPVSFAGPFTFYTIVNKDSGGEESYILECGKVFFDITEIVEQVQGKDGSGEQRLVIFPTAQVKVDTDGNTL
jgi:hypothetical protein